jgi:uncharacterized protein (TIGR02217 family)
MSNAVFPTLSGIGWNIVRSPQFQTKTQRSISGRELRATFQQYPLWQFSLNYEFLRDGILGTDYDTITGFFLARQGSFDSFLFTDPYDNAVTDANIGTGNGSLTTFQLARSYGAGGNLFTEPVNNVTTLSNVKVNGVTKTLGTDYTVSSTGLVTFATAPLNTYPVTWSGIFYYRCRFVEDVSAASIFMANLWELKKCDFIGSPSNKV